MERSKSVLDSSKDMSSTSPSKRTLPSDTPLRLSKKAVKTLNLEEQKKLKKWDLLLINREGVKIHGINLPKDNDKDMIFPEVGQRRKNILISDNW